MWISGYHTRSCNSTAHYFTYLHDIDTIVYTVEALKMAFKKAIHSEGSIINNIGNL